MDHSMIDGTGMSYAGPGTRLYALQVAHWLPIAR